MKTSKLKPVFRLTSFKDIVRTVATRSNSNSTVSSESLKSWNEIPGPSSLPVLGQLHHFLPGAYVIMAKGDLHGFEVPGAMTRLFDKYGLIVRFDATLGMKPTLLLGDPESSAHILRSENWLPIRPGFYSLEHYRRSKKDEEPKSQTGLLTEHGDVWKDFRSTVNHVMLQPKTIKLYYNILDEVAIDMVERLKADRDEKNMIRRKFDTEMNLWALESIGTVALGCRLDCLNATLDENSPQNELIQCIHDLFITMDQLDFKPNIWRFYATPQYKKAMKLYERHETLTKHFLEKGIKQLKQNGGQKSDHEKGVLEKLLEINEEYAYIMASDMLFAGVDTTHIAFCHRDMSLMDEHYPQAKEYIPERWIVDKNDPLYYGNAHPFAHGPFGFGVRSCIGRRIAELEIEIFLTRIIENLKVDWFGPPPQLLQMAIIYIKGPFNFIFTDVK